LVLLDTRATRGSISRTVVIASNGLRSLRCRIELSTRAAIRELRGDRPGDDE
jgi:hypothetical protein